MFSVVKSPCEYVKDTVVVDLSWLAYSSRFAMFSLSAAMPDGSVVPTGHIHGSLITISQLAYSMPRVILAADSKCRYRFDRYSEYKAGRKHDDYDIKNDIPLILAAATLFPNVYFMGKDGYEADDLINSYTATGWDPVIFGKDNDLMQIPNVPFRMAFSTTAAKPVFVDVPAYIADKYKIPLPFLPKWYKVVRGDSSDNIHPGVPRYPTKDLLRLCMDLKDETGFPAFEAWARGKKDDRIIRNLETAKLNFDLVSPYAYDGLPELKKIRGWDVFADLAKYRLQAVGDILLQFVAATKGKE